MSKLPPTWHCYPEPGQTYADLVAQHGRDKMLVAILHMPELLPAQIAFLLKKEPRKPWWRR